MYFKIFVYVFRDFYMEKQPLILMEVMNVRRIQASYTLKTIFSNHVELIYVHVCIGIRSYIE